MCMDRKKLNRKQLINSFGGKCQICGYDKCSAALEFHHRDPTKKEIEISKFANNNKLSYKQIRELEKCILLCSNCHKEAHAKINQDKIDEIPEIELYEYMF